MVLRTMRQCYGPFLGIDSVEAYIATGATVQYLKDNLSNCQVLIGDDKVIGLSVCEKNLLDLLMIDPEYHQQGFGSALLLDAENRLFHEFECIELESFEANAAADLFYRQAGWQEEERFTEAESGIRKIRFTKDKPAVAVL
jgi:ribosomal protein S18 acetylase RimI-like enzyme